MASENYQSIQDLGAKISEKWTCFVLSSAFNRFPFPPPWVIISSWYETEAGKKKSGLELTVVSLDQDRQKLELTYKNTRTWGPDPGEKGVTGR